MTLTGPLTLLSAAALLSVGPGTLSAQDDAVRMDLAERVAAAWEVDPERVRVDVSGAPEGPIDSLSVSETASDRWLVTFHAGERTVRRFVHVAHMAEVEVAAAPIARGDVVVPEAVAKETRMVAGAPREPAPTAVGMVAQRLIEAGTVLVDPAVRPPFVIRGGDRIDAVLQQGSVMMTVRGEALGAAREGEMVQVRLASGVRRRARATRPGVVTLIPGGG